MVSPSARDGALEVERRASGALAQSRDAQRSAHALHASASVDSSPLRLAAQKALGGGLVGAGVPARLWHANVAADSSHASLDLGAMAANVVLLMWLRTSLFVQYARGLSFPEAVRYIYRDGGGGVAGIRRFYCGVGYGLLLAPISRFGDTAANAGVLSLFDSSPHFADSPMLVKSTAAGVAAGVFRGLIMPLDTIKTMVQVEGGARGREMLRQKLSTLGARRALFAGALGAGSAHALAFVPWFTVHNLLQERIPKKDVRTDGLVAYAGRAMSIGLAASVASDTASNALHVLKTLKQTAPGALSYAQAVQAALGAGGLVRGLLFRGLGTRVAASAANGAIFTLLWNLGQDSLDESAVLSAEE